MKNWLIFTVFTLLLLSSQAALCQIDGPIAQAALQKETLALLSSSQFMKLEEYAEKYITNKERFPDGGWKLYYFFNAFQNPPYETDTDWKKHMDLVEAWKSAFPSSDAARTALAGAWIGNAWFARGTKYQIKEGGYPLMMNRLAKAAEILQKVPDSYIHVLHLKLQLALALSAPREDFDSLLEKALSIEPSYIAFYADGINYYSPRWYGEPGEWARKLEQFDRKAPRKEGVYARVAFGFIGSEWRKFSEGTINWGTMKKSLNDIAYDSPWIANMAASYACIAEDYEMVRKLFNKIGTSIYHPAWQYTNFDKCMEKAGLKTDLGDFEKSIDYQYMQELSKNNQWAKDLLRKWREYKMVGYTY